MSFEQSYNVNQPKQPDSVLLGTEKLTGFQQKLWHKTKAIFERLNLKFLDDAQGQALEKIKSLENDSEDDKFLDLEVVRDGEEMQLRTVAQMDEQYSYDYQINYDENDPTTQQEAERWLNREIIVNERLANI